jgi:hypothetical protein
MSLRTERICRSSKCVFVNFLKILSLQCVAYRQSPFFTDIYGLKFCVQFLHCDLQSSKKLRSVNCQLATDVSGQPTCPIFKGQVGHWLSSTPRKVPGDRRSHFIVDYIFPAKPLLFLMENQHFSSSRAIMPQGAVNNCLTCIKCAEASYSGCC